jgi:hypothetical protein
MIFRKSDKNEIDYFTTKDYRPIVLLNISRAKVPSLATLTRHYPVGSALQQNENITKTIIYSIFISSSEESPTTPLDRRS